MERAERERERMGWKRERAERERVFFWERKQRETSTTIHLKLSLRGPLFFILLVVAERGETRAA